MEQKIEELQKALVVAQQKYAELEEDIVELRSENEDLRLENEDLQIENEDLREREALALKLIEKAPDAFFVHDLEGRFIFVNEAACTALGYGKKETLNMSVMDVEYGLTPEQIHAFWDEVIAGKNVKTEALLKRKDGFTLPVDIHIGLFDASGNKVFYGIARDISERKKYEERLRQSHKMEAVGTLAGGIAHDFNNILWIILGCAESGADRLPDFHPTHEYLKEIRLAVLRAKEVIQQLLSFSQKSDETREPMRIDPLVKESLKLMRSTIPANIELFTSFDDNCFMVMANPAQIHQVIINLCANASHAVRGGGGIYVDLKNRNFGLSDTSESDKQLQGEFLQLTIRDTGCGMPQELVERIFDPYFTTKGVGKGSGMGLAVVHGIVQSLGGVIKVTSQVDEGTTFNIFLPAIEGQYQRVTSEIDGKRALPSGSESILIVDDEKAIIQRLTERLESLGYTVKGATVSVEALEVLKEHPHQFDLMITDMAMPKMTGEILIQHVKQIRPDLPVILCTGFSERVDVRAPQKIGAAKILLKPITSAELAVAIREVLDSH